MCVYSKIGSSPVPRRPVTKLHTGQRGTTPRKSTFYTLDGIDIHSGCSAKEENSNATSETWTLRNVDTTYHTINRNPHLTPDRRKHHAKITRIRRKFEYTVTHGNEGGSIAQVYAWHLDPSDRKTLDNMTPNGSVWATEHFLLIQFTLYKRDGKLLPRLNQILSSSGLLRGIRWFLLGELNPWRWDR